MRRLSNLSLVLLTLVVGAGIIAWSYQLLHGMIVTNLRNSFTWGLYIATWAFFVGTAAGGLVVSSAIYVFGAKELKPIAKVASMTAFLFAGAAMAIVVPDIGRPDRILNMLLHPNLQSMLLWDAVVLSSYALVSGIYTFVLLRPSILERGVVLPGGIVLGRRSLSKEQLAAAKAWSEKWAQRLAPVALPLAVAIHTVTAWVLATQLGRSWWFGGALAPTFIAAALASGPAIVILASGFVYGFREKLMPTYVLLAKVAVLAAIVLLFIYYNDFVVKLWWKGGRESEAVKLVFHKYLGLHLVEIVFLLSAIVFFARWPRHKAGLIAGSVSVIIGVYAHRLLLIPPAYNLIPLRVPYVVGSKVEEWSYPIAVGEIGGSVLAPERVFVSFWNYIPSVVEVCIVAGVMAGLILTFFVLTRILPLTEGDAQ